MKKPILYEPAGHPSLGARLAALCAAAALLLLLFITFWLSSVSMTETVDMNMNNPAWENVDTHVDNFLENALWLMLFAAVAFLWMLFTRRVPPSLLTAVCLLGVTAFGIWFVLTSQSAPTHDSQIVSNAAYLASKGDGSALASDYFKRFPFQLGYVRYSELLIGLLGTEDNYLAIEIVNVLTLAVTYFALLRCVRLLWGEGNAYRLTALLALLCLPPVLFATFTYGTLPGLMLSSVALWQVLAMKGTKADWLHAPIAALSIGMGVAVKKNFTIFFVAILILLALRLLRRFTLSGVVCILLSCLSVWGVAAGVQASYEKRFDLELGKGIPMTSWAAMGINEAYIAPGWYESKYTIVNFRESGMDHDVANARSLEEIRTRVQYLRENPDYANEFFDEKNKSQWNEPSCQSIWTNQVRGQYGEKTGLAKWICGEGEARVKGFMNLFQQFVYVFAMLGVGALLRTRRLEDVLIPTVLIGGFLYHTVCEAKSQYIIPYLVLLLPLAAYGAAAVLSRTPIRRKSRIDAFGMSLTVTVETDVGKNG